MKAIVKFGFGVKHPLFGKAVEAKITPCTGYNGLCVYGETVEMVDFPEDPHGFHVFDSEGNFMHYRTREAYSDYVSGWVEKIWSDELQTWLTAEEYSEKYAFEKKMAEYFPSDVKNDAEELKRLAAKYGIKL